MWVSKVGITEEEQVWEKMVGSVEIGVYAACGMFKIRGLTDA